MAELITLDSVITLQHSDSSTFLRNYNSVSDFALSAASNLQTVILRIVNLLSNLY